MRLTKRKIRSLIKEEKAANKMYRGYGLYGIAKQEHGHSQKLKKMLESKIR